MKGKSLKEWVEIYEQKTGDKAEVPKGFTLFYLAERGFASMKFDVEKKMAIVYQTCGDGKFWRDFAEMKAVEYGLDCIGTICTRDIKPYIRAFGWQILKEFEVDVSKRRFVCQDSIGREVIVTFKDFNENGDPEYWVTQYLNKKATLNEERISFLKGDAKDA